MRAFLLSLALLAVPATAQTVSPLTSPPSAEDLAAAQAQAAAAAQAATDAATAAANACKPSATVPPMETIGGAAGNGQNCRLANSVQPRISRSVSFTTGAAGTSAVTYQDMGTTPVIYVQENVASNATNIPKCFPVTGTITSTGVTIKCYITQSILGLGLIPFTTATAGVSGQILAIPVAQ